MATIVTRSGKGSPLTNSEVDSNFTNLNNDKLETSAAYVHPNHTGEVTSTGDGATVIADNVVDEANLKVSNTPTNGYFLSAQSGNTGGLTWATVPAGYTDADVDTHLNKSTATTGEVLSWSGTDYDWIAAGGGGQTGAQIKTAYQAESNAFTDAQFTKLAGIETSADVTDATNVTAAGALMTSGGSISGNLSVDGGTIKLDGNYPVGTNNVALGNTALDSNVSGASNTAIGADALTANTASNNTAVGYQALYASQGASPSNNAFGWSALGANTTGNSNCAFGADLAGYIPGSALGSNTTGFRNSAFGGGALHKNTVGIQNVAIGGGALYNNTSSHNTTAVGCFAGASNTEAGGSVYVGNYAGLATTGEKNTMVGYWAGADTTTGTGNTFIGGDSTGSGNGAGKTVTTGSKNTILGTYDGNQGGLDIRTSSNNIVLSDGDGNPRLTINSSGVISGDGSGLTGVGASTTAGAVGTYAFLASDVIISQGTTTAGSNLQFAGSPRLEAGSAPSGTWRCMGRTSRTGYSDATVFVRTA